MKLKSSFVVHSIANSQIMVPIGESADSFHGFLRSNETAAFLVDNLKEDTSKEQLVQKLLDEYEVDEIEASKAVDYVVEMLNTIGALES